MFITYLLENKMGQISTELYKGLKALYDLVPKLPWGHKAQLRSALKAVEGIGEEVHETEHRRKEQYAKSTEIRATIAKTCAKCGYPKLGKTIPFTFNKRFTDSFGAAGSGAVEFSGPLWGRATPKQRKQVIIHETCHVLSEEKYGENIKPHGQEWEEMMELAGAEPIIYHDVDNEDLYRPQRCYAIRCKSCAHEDTITQNMRTRILNGSQHFCRQCKTPTKPAALKDLECLPQKKTT